MHGAEGVRTMKTLLSVEEASQRIREGAKLLIAGEEGLLAALPQGDWIGGTTPYMMTEDGGVCSTDKVQAIELPDTVLSVKAHLYTAANLKLIPKDYKKNGFAIVIVPAFTQVHTTFAKDSSSWPEVFSQPLVGWIAGSHLDRADTTKPKVFNGQTGESSDSKVVVLHSELDSHLAVRMNIVNLFQTGSGDVIAFPQCGFETTDCTVNGEKRNFAEYLTEKNVDTSIPMVSNYFGALVNVSLRKVDSEAGKVSFFSPVFPGVHYRFAVHIEDYPSAYQARLSINQLWAGDPVYACNCILNYQVAGLEGKMSGKMLGPVVFGEIAYMMLNHTLVYLTFEPK
jgi:hypothetical protein